MRQADNYTTSNTITVRVQKAGYPAGIYELPVDATVEEALLASGYDLDSIVTVAGTVAKLDNILDDGDTLFISRKGDPFGL